MCLIKCFLLTLYHIYKYADNLSLAFYSNFDII